MQAVNAMKNALDTQNLEENLDLDIAVRHNIRRKLRMIKAMHGLYRYVHGNGERPINLPSAEFNPFQGDDKTNIHYLFKAMRRRAPWDLPKDQLVVPTALTLLMVEVAAKLFPSPEVFRITLLVQEFVNRWTLPKFHPEWSQEELEHEVNTYRADMDDFEKRFKSAYADLALYFGSLEDPKKNPVVRKINETHKNAAAVAQKVCGKEPSASFVAQEKALKIWRDYKSSPEVKAKYCAKDHHLTYDDVFDYCKRQLSELGLKSATAFAKAVKAAQKRTSRLGKETR